MQPSEAQFNSGSALRAKRSNAPSLRARLGGPELPPSKRRASVRFGASALTSSCRRIRPFASEAECPVSTPGDETSPPADLASTLRTLIAAVQLGPGRPRSGVDLVARWAHNPPDAGCNTGLRNPQRRMVRRALHKRGEDGSIPSAGTGGYLAGACALQARAQGPIPWVPT